MEKITGMEAAQAVPPKVLAIYHAVEQLIASGENINSVSVSAITELAGIGKGTAYDYFENKDEIIACSLLYQIRCLSQSLREVLGAKDNFAEQIAYCLEEIEKRTEKQQCFMRFVHVLTENSGYCQLVKQKMGQMEFEHYLPQNVVRECIVKAVERGEMKSGLPMDYMIHEVFSKLLTYLLSIHTHKCMGAEVEVETIRPYVYRSLINELCEKNV